MADQPPHRDQHLFRDGDDVVLIDEAHLEVQLGELRLPIRPEVLVPIAPGDLVVAFQAADHQQLLEQLRRLRQRVPRSRPQSSRDQEVARALRRRSSQRGRLDLDEVVPIQHLASRAIHPAAQAHRLGRSRSAQIEIAVLQACFLADVDVLVDLERQRRGLVEHLDSGATTSTSPVAIRGLTLPSSRRSHLSAYRDAPLVAQVVRDRVVAYDDLHDAGGVPQIDERHPTVIAATGHPAGEGHGVAGVGRAERAGLVRAEHRSSSPVRSIPAAAGRRPAAARSQGRPVLDHHGECPGLRGHSRGRSGTRRTGCRAARRTGSACRTSRAGRHLGRDPAGPQPSAIASLAGRLASSGSATSTAEGTDRDASSLLRANSGMSIRVTPERDADPGIARPAVAGQRVVAAAGADRADALEAGHPGLEDRPGVVVQAAGDPQVGLDDHAVGEASGRSPRPRRCSSAIPSSSSGWLTPSAAHLRRRTSCPASGWPRSPGRARPARPTARPRRPASWPGSPPAPCRSCRSTRITAPASGAPTPR